MKRGVEALVVVLVAIVVAGVVAGPLGAQGVPNDSALERETRAVASQLRCPVCQGLSIEDSPSELSQQMRTLVRYQLRAGKSPDQVRRYFVSKYGEWILLSPPAHGVDALVYVLPLLAVTVGAGIIVIAVRCWTRGSESGAHQVNPHGDASPSGPAP